MKTKIMHTHMKKQRTAIRFNVSIVSPHSILPFEMTEKNILI